MNSCKLLVIGTVWPEPGSSAAGIRMMQLIRAFQSDGWDITFASTAARSPFRVDAASNKISFEEIQLNSSSFDAYIKSMKPDAVLFDRFMTEEQFGWRVAEHCPKALRILDLEDLHCLRNARLKALKSGRIFEPENLLSDERAFREIASVLRSDLTLVISEFEMKLLSKLFRVDERLLMYLPYLLEPIDLKFDAQPDFNSRVDFVTIGNFRHEPNVDSVVFLKQAIWPLIREKLPDTHMHVYGAYPSSGIQQLHDSDNGFLIHGRAESADTVLQNARVCLAPLRFGAGLKGKLIEAMRSGTPSVTTNIGAEGIPGRYDWPGFTENDAESFADAAINLYTTQDIWEKAVQKGFQLLQNRFQAADFLPALHKALHVIMDNPDAHRKQNFYGGMLAHHAFASTKYLSKWIEAKNRSEEN